jgi:hypothetical protein
MRTLKVSDISYGIGRTLSIMVYRNRTDHRDTFVPSGGNFGRIRIIAALQDS